MALTRIQAMTARSEVDNYTDDEGNEITCANCSTTAREIYSRYEPYPSEKWMIGPVWYCSNDCYEEATKNEG